MKKDWSIERGESASGKGKNPRLKREVGRFKRYFNHAFRVKGTENVRKPYLKRNNV